MTDIVELLRAWCSEIRRHPAPIAEAVPMVQQAADEIDRLRSDLDREIAAHVADLAEIKRLRGLLREAQMMCREATDLMVAIGQRFRAGLLKRGCELRQP